MRALMGPLRADRGAVGSPLSIGCSQAACSQAARPGQPGCSQCSMGTQLRLCPLSGDPSARAWSSSGIQRKSEYKGYEVIVGLGLIKLVLKGDNWHQNSISDQAKEMDCCYVMTVKGYLAPKFKRLGSWLGLQHFSIIPSLWKFGTN